MRSLRRLLVPRRTWFSTSLTYWHDNWHFRPAIVLFSEFKDCSYPEHAHNMLKSFDNIKPFVLILINLVLILVLGLLDYLTGIEFSFSIFYFLPITIITWYVGVRTGIFFSFTSASIWFLADLFGDHFYSSNYIFGWNVFMRLCIFIIITLIIHNLKKNSELVMKNRLIAQKSYDIINTSQRMTAIIVESIAKYNSELIFWIARQKANGKQVSNIIESTCHNIASNLHALTEICFSIPSNSEKKLGLENFMDSLQKKLEDVNKKIHAGNKKQ